MAANHGLARADYLAGMKYKDIAAKYGVSVSTVKSWSQRYGWTSGRKSLHKSMRTKLSTQCAQGTRVALAQLASVEANEELTDNERDFCICFARTNNATQSYLTAFSGSYRTAHSHGYELLARPAVRVEIQRLKEIRRQSLMVTAEDVVEMYMRIAFADLKDYVEWGSNGFRNIVRFLPADKVDGQLVSEVKVGKEGASIRLADRMVALKWLADYFELNPKDRHADEYAKRRLELDERKAGDSGEDEIAEARKLLEGVPSEF